MNVRFSKRIVCLSIGLAFFLFAGRMAGVRASATNESGAVTTRVELTAAEQQAKAAFVYNFAKFTTWPTNVLATATTPIAIGLLGQDSLEGALRKLVAGKRIDSHTIEVRLCSTMEEARRCQVLYICRTELDRWPGIVQQLADAPVLTVSDLAGFARAGGMLEIDSEAGQAVRFSANVVASQKAGLVISSKLLRLAQRVWQSTDEREAP
jgi:hypothetical protein